MTESGRVCYVYVNRESGLFVYIEGPCICILCQVDTRASYVHPVFIYVTLYRYMFPIVYLFVAHMKNPNRRVWLSDLDLSLHRPHL